MRKIKKLALTLCASMGVTHSAWADFDWSNGVTQAMKSGDAIGGVTGLLSLGASAVAVGIVVAFMLIAAAVIKHGVDKMRTPDGGIYDFFQAGVVAGVVMAFGIGMGYVVDINSTKIKQITVKQAEKKS